MTKDRIICIVSNDPYQLVQAGTITPLLAQQLLRLPLQLI